MVSVLCVVYLSWFLCVILCGVKSTTSLQLFTLFSPLVHHFTRSLGFSSFLEQLLAYCTYSSLSSRTLPCVVPLSSRSIIQRILATLAPGAFSFHSAMKYVLASLGGTRTITASYFTILITWMYLCKNTLHRICFGVLSSFGDIHVAQNFNSLCLIFLSICTTQ